MNRTAIVNLNLCIVISVLSITGCSKPPQNDQPLPPALQMEAERPEALRQSGTLEQSLRNHSALPSIPTPAASAAPPPAPNPEQQQPQPHEQSTPSPAPPPAKKTEKRSTRQQEGAPASTGRKSNKQLTLSQLIKKYPNLLLLKGSSQKKQIALTFDDAPDTKYTLQVLDILKQHNVKATFFVVGRLAEKYPSVIKRMDREGHVVGNHSYNHALLTKLSDTEFQSQIARTQRAVKNAIGYTPRLIRPPYGEISESQLLWASRNRYVIVNWNVDSRDWKQLSPAEVSANVLDHAAAGSIILQHSGGGPNQNLSGTVSALPEIISTLKARGYELVTLPELLKVSKQL